MKKFSLIMLGLLWASTSFAQSVRILAVVNDEVITSYDLEMAKEGDYSRYELSASGLGVQSPVKKTGRDLLDDMVRNKLLDQDIRKLGIAVESREIDQELALRLEQLNMTTAEFTKELSKQGFTMEQYRRGIEDQLKLIRFIARRIRPRIMIDDASAADYFKKNPQAFRKPDKIHLHRIEFVSADARKRVATLVKEIEKTELTKALAMPGVTIEDIGFVHGGDLNPNVRQAVSSIDEGKLTPVFRSGDQWMAFRVIARQAGGDFSFEEISKEVRGELLEKRVESELNQYVNQLRAQAHVEIKM